MSTDNVRIERLQAGGGPRFRAIRLAALADSPDAFGSILADAKGRAGAEWEQQIHDLPTWVAVQSGDDVGLVRCMLDEHNPTEAWLISMWVAPSARGLGVAEALIDTLITWCSGQGLARVQLDVGDANHHAVSLYARKGFRASGRTGHLPAPREHVLEHHRVRELRSDDQMVAYALETTPDLLPHLPELLADLDELGCDAELIVSILADLDLPADTRVLDLGCGKGAVAVEIADELGLQVHGIDLFAPFVASAQQLAVDTGVAELCTFSQGNLLQLRGQLEAADVVVYAALGDVLGRYDSTMGVLREFVRPGGYILIHDDFLKDGGSNNYPRFENYGSRDDSHRWLQAHGDRLVREVLEQDDDDGEDTDSAQILARAQQLAERFPEQAAELLAFARDQAEEVAYMAGNMQPAVWVLQRT